jgi:superfamily I DNA/RNA helicase
LGHQIRRQADRLLPNNIADVDGVSEDRRGAISVFNGPAPTIQTFGSKEEEISGVSSWIKARIADGVSPGEIGVFVRSESEIDRAASAVDQSGNPYADLTDVPGLNGGNVAIGTMHLAKGLEFRAVAVMACDDEVLPSQTRIETVSDDSDLEEVYNTERHLLYVACTRARDFLWVSGADPASEFLDDLTGPKLNV